MSERGYSAKAIKAFELLPEEYKHALEKAGLEFEDFTCSQCPSVEFCGLAFDAYSVDGDCLAEK